MRPFFTTVNSPSRLNNHEKEVTTPTQKAGIDWTKITDPRQSIRMADSIDPHAIMEDEFSELELLGGKTKSGGVMLYKLQADKAILENINVSFCVIPISFFR